LLEVLFFGKNKEKEERNGKENAGKDRILVWQKSGVDRRLS